MTPISAKIDAERRELGVHAREDVAVERALVLEQGPSDRLATRDAASRDSDFLVEEVHGIAESHRELHVVER